MNRRRKLKQRQKGEAQTHGKQKYKKSGLVRKGLVDKIFEWNWKERLEGRQNER